MFVKPCPACGKMPKIKELPRKSKSRRRMCGCRNGCLVVPIRFWNSSWFVFVGDGDDNDIYSLWNEGVDIYKEFDGCRTGFRYLAGGFLKDPRIEDEDEEA